LGNNHFYARLDVYQALEPAVHARIAIYVEKLNGFLGIQPLQMG
jgi:hypothetical protein